MCLHFEVLFTSERYSTFLGVFFWGISILGGVFILRAVFILNNELLALIFTHILYARTLFMQDPCRQ